MLEGEMRAENIHRVSRSINSAPDDSNKTRHNAICAALWILGRVPHLVNAVKSEERRNGGEARLSCILEELSPKEILTDTSRFRKAMENAGPYLAAYNTKCDENLGPMDTVQGILRLFADSQAILERTSQATYLKEVKCLRHKCPYKKVTTEMELELRCRLPNVTAQGTISSRSDFGTKTKCPKCGMDDLVEKWSMQAAPKCLVVTWGTLARGGAESETLRVPQAPPYSERVFTFKLAAMSVSVRGRVGCMFRHDNNFYFANSDSVKEVQRSEWLNARREMAIYTLKPSLDHGPHAVPSRSEPEGVARRAAPLTSTRDRGKRRRTDGTPSGVLPSARHPASRVPKEVINVDEGDSDTASGIGANHAGDGQDPGGSGVSILSASELSGRTIGYAHGDNTDRSGQRRIVHLDRAASVGAMGRCGASQETTTSPGARQVSNAESDPAIVDETDDDVQMVPAKACCSSSMCAGGSTASASSISGKNSGIAPNDEAMPRDRALALKPKDKEETLGGVMCTPADSDLAVLSRNLSSGTKHSLSRGADKSPSVTWEATKVACVVVNTVGHIVVPVISNVAAFSSTILWRRDSVHRSPGQPSSLSESKSPDAETHQRDSKQQQETQSTERDGGRSEEKFDEAEEQEKAPQDSPRGKGAVDRAVVPSDGPEGEAKDVWEAPREDVNGSNGEEGSDKNGTLDETEDLRQEVELLREKGKDPGRSAEEGKDERSKKGCGCCAKGGGSRGEARFTKIRGIALFDEHFCRIIDSNGWLTSQIVDIRVKQLQEAYPENLYFNSSFFCFLCPTSDKDGAFVVDYPRVRGWTKSSRLPDGKSSLFDMKKIFIPINQGNVHWVLAVVDLDARKSTACGVGDAPGADEADDPEVLISFFDSLARDGSAYVEAIQQYLVSELSCRAKMWHGKFSLKSRPPENAPRQLNSSDCGVLILHMMQKLSTGSTEGLGRLSQREILDLRLKLMEDIRE